MKDIKTLLKGRLFNEEPRQSEYMPKHCRYLKLNKHPFTKETAIYLLCFLFALWPSEGLASSPVCHKQLSHALAHGSTADMTCSLEKKLAQWVLLSKPQTHFQGTGPNFETIATFILENPSWPVETLLQRAEECAEPSSSRGLIIRLFSKHPPKTPKGLIAFASALSEPGVIKAHKNLLPALVKQSWHTHTFDSKEQEEYFFQKFKIHLTPEDHITRFEFFLYGKEFQKAENLIALAPPSLQTTFKNRLSIARGERPGKGKAFLVEQILSALAQEDFKKAHRLLALKPHNQGQAKALFKDRKLQAREILWDNPKLAYQIISAHGLEGISEDYEYAEDLAGHICLFLLKDYPEAIRRFESLFEKVTTPISRASAAFFAGKAYSFSGSPKKAKEWWEKAAQHPTTFWGQEALRTLKRPFRPSFHIPSAPTSTGKGIHLAESFQAAKIFFQALEKDLIQHKSIATDDLFELLKALAAHAQTPSEKHALLTYCPKERRVHLTRLLARTGDVLLREAFPVVPHRYSAPVSRALVHSIIRRESSFDPHAISHAGARGLMQIMPHTAVRIAQKHKIHLKDSDTELHIPTKNIELGTHELAHLLDRYDGNELLALAAYDGGKVDLWLEETPLPDPRKGENERLMFLVFIPYFETRAYILRVLEAKPFYEHLLKEPVLNSKTRI